jgi:hypothetical protein
VAGRRYTVRPEVIGDKRSILALFNQKPLICHLVWTHF